MTIRTRPWWKDSTVYQIYPSSFFDSNGDGLGDIPGIVSKISYLASLGVDVIWLSPMYDSPQHDMGYDISNYEAVYPPYGTVADIETLISACHSRGMKFILDLVVNHTSDEHAWFQESRRSKDNPKRDWYIWRPAKYAEDGTRMPPNNWRSFFSGSAWAWDEGSQEYYLHLFATQQPDLNWENPATRQAIYDSAMRFWLDKGVDGFRVDTVNMYSKGTELPDAPIIDEGIFEQPASGLFCNGPRMHEFLREMNTEILNKYDTMTVGELPHTPDPAHVLRYVGSGDKQLDMVFQFDIVDLGIGRTHKYEYEGYALSELKSVVSKWQQFIEGSDGWTTAFCENHDQGRSVSRFGSDAPEFRERSAKMLALMMCALTGTLFVYQGQEIGMINAPKEWPISDYKDIESINYYNSVAERTDNDPKALGHVMKSIQILGRDHARLPMQWDDSPHAGFTTKKEGAWMRIHDEYRTINVAKQEKDPKSVLSFWKSVLKIRKEYRELFIHGAFEAYDIENQQTFVFGKRHGEDRAVVALNFTGEEQPFKKPDVGGKFELLVGNVEGVDGTEDKLAPWEGRIYLVS
ncbi:glycoside hydrolase family 13 protein [Hyaloscypha bicolor E]|uniref:Glycoside hydrolase family 13 protein n=1 Tax=Hyaloscypha bicolor E TaxID=1095630 RepID=A0A2J6TA45_9HELO|nr:glycoside hydrolase family 13 protein [Hyaloscypha bicolor E]PMD59894.1 glycoside hydrolase family 13 protein [Hyaloscypha bicolor E]